LLSLLKIEIRESSTRDKNACGTPTHQKEINAAFSVAWITFEGFSVAGSGGWKSDTLAAEKTAYGNHLRAR
jgi:hypothetical protein